jgi:molecular chaperone GrpE
MKKKQPAGIDNGQDYKNLYLRALADYQNLLRRSEEEKTKLTIEGNRKLLIKLLPIGDDLERAIVHTEESDVIRIIWSKWQVLLAQEGVTKITITEKSEFNPSFMECIQAEEGGKRLVEVQAGYMLNGILLRPARVKIIK